MAERGFAVIREHGIFREWGGVFLTGPDIVTAPVGLPGPLPRGGAEGGCVAGINRFVVVRWMKKPAAGQIRGDIDD